MRMRTLARRATTVVSAAALTMGMAVAVPLTANADPGDTVVQILGINDFHGRIDADGQSAGAAVIAGAVTELTADNTAGPTIFAGAGDFVGASTFPSFVAHDKPTIDAMNEAGLEVSSVGNHEFDQGYDDLVNRIMKPYDPDSNPYGGANWKYLGANVKNKSDGSDALAPTWMTEVDGVKVGFVGAVTEHLNELVSPAGIKDLDITDIAKAANAGAQALKDDGAQIVVLLVHEGYATTDCTGLTDPNSDLGKVVGALDGNIDAVISGHTHLKYNCTVPKADRSTAGAAPQRDLPVVQSGSYGYNLDQLLFTVDSSGAITDIQANILPLTKQVDDPDNPGEKKWEANYTPDEKVAQIVEDADANAKVLGAEVLGRITGPFDRAKQADGTENRGGESNLGNMVAEAQRWDTRSATTGSAQIAFMNPGGLRADMEGKNASGYPADVTYEQAADVQPFANTLVNMQLTGAQIRTVLEQQWQPEGSSRPFLRLGISKGFTYTYDPNGAKNHHIIDMWLNGTPIKDDQSYSVTVNSFLAAGGDNFYELANGTNPKDTGMTDLEGMVKYLAANATADDPLQVDSSQRSVGVSFPSGAPDGYSPGDTVTFTLSSLMFPAPTGSKQPVDNKVTVTMGDLLVGTFPVSNKASDAKYDETGTADVSFPMPASAPAGTVPLTITGDVTGTKTTVNVHSTGGCHPFPDVDGTNLHCANIAWLKDTGITKPLDGKYHPANGVNRGAMTAFLFRLTHPGQASPTCTSKPFPDVAVDDLFCGYIQWAKDNHIVFGYADGHYGPDNDVTRGAMVALLHRIVVNAAAPKCTTAPYADVRTTDLFCGSIAWAKDTGVTYGVGDGTNFGMTESVTRQAMASFLHRIAGRI